MIFILWACVGITAAVCGVMIYSIATFPKARGESPAMFRHSTLVEILWSIVPILILFGMAAPAVRNFVATDSKSEVTRLAADSSQGE